MEWGCKPKLSLSSKRFDSGKIKLFNIAFTKTNLTYFVNYNKANNTYEFTLHKEYK